LLSGEHQAADWQPSDLLQESYLRLLDWRGVQWQNRAHFFATTARVMRRVLVSAARARHAVKRGKGASYVAVDALEIAAPGLAVDLVALEDALSALSAMNPRPSQVIGLRFFGGFTAEETAEALGVSVRTVMSDWNTARAWLHRGIERSTRTSHRSHPPTRLQDRRGAIRSSRPHDQSRQRRGGGCEDSSTRARGSTLSHVRSVFIDCHHLRGAGVHLRTATGDLGIPCVCSAGLGFRIETADQFER